MISMKPKLSNPVPSNSCTHGNDWFDRWYVNSQYSKTFVSTLELNEGTGKAWGSGFYRFANESFFPLDNIGWVGSGKEEKGDGGHNFSFTSEVRYWFQYDNTKQPSLEFKGDDDVWVFVAGRLVVDIGGVHNARIGRFDLIADGSGRGDADYTQQVGGTGTIQLDLQNGQVYEIVVFQAERHETASRYQLTLGGFNKTRTVCAPRCGNGIVTPDEVCDDGTNDGSYGGCVDCQMLGPHCGDGTVNGPEKCDDGVNLSTYGGCAPGCVTAAFCGDGQVDASHGEQCDDGVNDGGYSECAPGCLRGARCGDGVVQKEIGEACDDGNLKNGDGCSASCRIDEIR